MLSSIHPLGERARQNRWWVTVTAFTVGAMTSGAGIGAALGWLGSLLPDAKPGPMLAATALVAVTAGALDIARVKPPGPARQVNETWIGAFRGWVYGGGFGLELGLGFFTYVVTWGVYATYVAAALTTTPLAGAVVGLVFGLGRSVSLWLAAVVDRPSRLTSFNRRLVLAGPVVRRASGLGLAVMGTLVLAGGLL